MENAYVTEGDHFALNISCFPTEPIKAWELKVSFPPELLQVINISQGDFFDGYQTFAMNGLIDNVNGTIINAYGLVLGQGNVSEAGHLLTIVFNAIAPGNATVGIYGVGVTNETGYVARELYNGTVHIAGIYVPPENVTQPPDENDTQPQNDTNPPPNKNDMMPPSSSDDLPPSSENAVVQNQNTRLEDSLSTFGTLMVALVLVNFAIAIFARLRY